jgi:uncharacterized membrane protein
MPSTDLLSGSGDDNALKSFLDRVVPYEKAGAIVPNDLLQFGFFGSIIVIVTGLLASAFPDPASIRDGGFYLVLGDTAASVTALMKALAIPAIVAGGSLLVVDAFLMKVRTSAHWRSVIVAQAAVGGAAGAICTGFLALLILNLVLWIIIVALILMTIGVLLSALAGG